MIRRLRIAANPVGWSISHIDSEIAIEGFPALSFVTPTRTFVANDNHTAGFSRDGFLGTDLFT